MSIQHLQSFSASSGASTGSTTTLTLNVPASIGVGSLIVIATGRDDSAGAAGGVASVTDSAGNSYTVNAGFALRSGTVETAISYAMATTALAASATITVTWNASRARRLAVAHVFSGLTVTSPLDVTSNSTVTSNPTSGGSHGASTSPSTTTPATSQAVELLFAACGYSGAAAFTPGSNFAAGPTASTSAGTADRNLTTEWRITSTVGGKTADGTLASSVGWSMCAVTFKEAIGSQQALTPASDITTTGWSKVGGTGTFASCLDEATADDADYATSPGNPSASVLEVKLASGSDPGTDNGFSAAYRLRSTSATSSTVVVGLYQGASLIASETRTNVPSTWTDYALIVTPTQAANITDFTDLRLRFTATAS